MARVRGVRRARAACGVGEHVVAGRERDGLDAGHVEPHLVVEVPGDRQHHRVAGGGEGGDGGAEGLVAAGGDRDLVGADVAAVEGGPAEGDLGAQRGEAEDRAVEVGGGVGADELGHRLAQGLGRGLDRGGLGEVDQRAVGGEVDALEPAAGLHDGGRGGSLDQRAQRGHRGGFLLRRRRA